jgi:hypothetical protein
MEEKLEKSEEQHHGSVSSRNSTHKKKKTLEHLRMTH